MIFSRATFLWPKGHLRNALNPLDKLLVSVLLFFQPCLFFFFGGFLWLFLLFFVSIPWFGHVVLLNCWILQDYPLAKRPPPELSDITSLSSKFGGYNNYVPLAKRPPLAKGPPPAGSIDS